MSKLYKDLFHGIVKEFDVQNDYRFPERLNGKSMEEIRDFAMSYIDRMPNAVVVFADKPYGKGATYFLNQEDPTSTNEVVYACTEDLLLNLKEIVKYLDKEIKRRRLRVFLFLGENGVYTQMPIRKLARLAQEGDANAYEDGKTVKDLAEEKYFAQFTEEGYLPAFSENAETEQQTVTEE